MNERTLRYLRQYLQNPNFVTLGQLDGAGITALPAHWQSALALDEEQWGILDDLTERPQLDLGRAVALFTNGAFGYVCADTSRADAESAGVVWWSDKAPRIGQHLWGGIDAWTALGMSG